MKDSLKGSMINFQEFHLQGIFQACPIFTPFLTAMFLPQMTIFKNSAVKTIKTSAKIIVIINVKNVVMQNALNCQITSTKKMNMKIWKTFLNFLKLASAIFYQVFIFHQMIALQQL